VFSAEEVAMHHFERTALIVARCADRAGTKEASMTRRTSLRGARALLLAAAALLAARSDAAYIKEIVRDASALSVGTDGALYWVYDYHWTQKINDTEFSNSLQQPASLQNVVVTADSLWATDPPNNQIWRFSLGGSPAVPYPVPTPNAGLFGIALGPDGKVWFTELSGNKIGRLSVTDGITEFPIPTLASGPYAIASAKDGRLYFTEFNGNKIGAITTSGVIDEIPIPTPNAHPAGIAVMSWDAMFTESGAGKLGVVSSNTGKLMDEYDLPDPSCKPWGIAVGPDFAFYFTERGSNKIGRFRSALDKNEYDIPTPGADPSSSSGTTPGGSGSTKSRRASSAPCSSRVPVM
jgi:virginiamycin B lyase